MFSMEWSKLNPDLLHGIAKIVFSLAALITSIAGACVAPELVSKISLNNQQSQKQDTDINININDVGNVAKAVAMSNDIRSFRDAIIPFIRPDNHRADNGSSTIQVDAKDLPKFMQELEDTQSAIERRKLLREYLVIEKPSGDKVPLRTATDDTVFLVTPDGSHLVTPDGNKLVTPRNKSK